MKEDNKAKDEKKLSGKATAENGKKMIETEKIALGKKDDKKEDKKQEADASQWRNEG